MNADDLMDELGNQWASPVAQSFMTYIRKSQFDKATNMLREESSLCEQEIDFLISHLKTENTCKKQLIEISEDERVQLKEEDKVLISFGGHLFESTLRLWEIGRSSDKKLSFFDPQLYDFVNISNATQIWRILDVYSGLLLTELQTFEKGFEA